VLKVAELPNQVHAAVEASSRGCKMYGVKNEGLEKGKPVRIASRMLGAKLIEPNFRLNDLGVVMALIFPEVK
jgi:hypothetical protein